MTDPATLERIVRLEEHLKSQDEKLETQDRKLDTIIRLTRAQDEKIKGLTDTVGDMGPTVERVADVVTTARVVGNVGRISLWIAPIVVGAIYWLSDRWHLVSAIFKRAP